MMRRQVMLGWEPAKHPRVAKGDGQAAGKVGGITDRITAQAKLVLAMNALLLLQMELMVFTQTVHGGLVDTLIEIWAEYHRRVDNIMQMARTPKRMIMAACFFKELELRSSQVIAKTEDGEKLRQELINNQLLTSDGAKWNQMAWSQEREQLLPTDGEVKDIHATHKILQQVYALAQMPGLILRFHAPRDIRRMGSKDGNAVIPWKLVIGHREQSASRLHNHLKSLCHLAVRQLVLARIRPAKMNGSPLAQRVSQMIS